MKTNVGRPDRIIRVVLAIAAAIVPATGTVSGTLGTVLYVVSGVLLVTSLTGFCGLYTLFGINTCKIGS
jgi:hypothetical protein